MAFRWKLKERLAAHHQLYQLADIQRVVEERTGVRWSLETISQLVNKTPRSLRVQTMQTVCTAFDCRLDDICEITPDAQPGFAKLLNCDEGGSYAPETSTGGKSCRSRGVRRRDRKKSRAVEGQIDLGQLFPEARQFSNSR
jgi:DNA-binding Xre family transcriptional regulator